MSLHCESLYFSDTSVELLSRAKPVIQFSVGTQKVLTTPFCTLTIALNFPLGSSNVIAAFEYQEPCPQEGAKVNSVFLQWRVVKESP